MKQRIIDFVSNAECVRVILDEEQQEDFKHFFIALALVILWIARMRHDDDLLLVEGDTLKILFFSDGCCAGLDGLFCFNDLSLLEDVVILERMIKLAHNSLIIKICHLADATVFCHELSAQFIQITHALRACAFKVALANLLKGHCHHGEFHALLITNVNVVTTIRSL